MLESALIGPLGDTAASPETWRGTASSPSCGTRDLVDARAGRWWPGTPLLRVICHNAWAVAVLARWPGMALIDWIGAVGRGAGRRSIASGARKVGPQERPQPAAGGCGRS